jgi:predicted transcriptional regulator
MTKLLEKAIEEAKTVPESKQDEVAAHLFEEIQRAKLLAGIEEGECAVREGRVVSHDEAKQRMAKWLK